MAEENPKVKIFSTPECVFCKMVKNYFRQLGVEFEEVDLTDNPEAIDWLRSRLGQFGVPVTVFNDSDLVIGWQKEQIDEYLKIHGLTK